MLAAVTVIVTTVATVVSTVDNCMLKRVVTVSDGTADVVDVVHVCIVT
jgi:hypothetical protein